MNDDLYTSLAWLPRTPADFAARCKALLADPAPGAAFSALANHGLDDNQLGRLGRTITKVAAEGRDLTPLEPFRLGLLGTGTLDLLVPLLVASAARYRLALECIQVDYGQAVQEALDPASRINTASPDAVLLAIDHRDLPLRFVAGDMEAERADIDGALAHITLFAVAFALIRRRYVLYKLWRPRRKASSADLTAACRAPGAA